MFLEDGTRTHFMNFLQREFPHWVPRYERLYAKKYAPDDYRREVSAMVRQLQQRYGLSPRERDVHDEKAADPVQVGFAW